MSCEKHCDEHLQNVALGFSIIESDKKFCSVTVFEGKLNNVKKRIRLTRVNYKRVKGDARYGAIVVSIGRPNYREREFLKQCKKAKCNPRRYWINRIAK